MNLRGNIKKLYAFSFLKMTLFPMAIITLFWKDQIGLSLTEIMVLQGIFSVATLLMEYPSGYLSDRLGYRFALNLASVLGIIGWSLYTVAGSFFGVLVAEIFLGASFAFISGADGALLFESLRAQGNEEDYRRFDGRMVGFAQLGEAVGALFAGLLYAKAPLLPFALQIGVWLLALAISKSLAEAPPDHRPLIHSHLSEAWKTCRKVFIDSSHLRYTVLLGTTLGVASFYPVWLIQPHMQQSGVPLSWFGPIWAGANLTVALFSLLSHRFYQRLGDRGMIALFGLLILAGYLGLGWLEGLWCFLFYYLLTAMRGMQGPVLRHHLQTSSSRSDRASVLSLKSLAFRLLFVATGPLVGWVADRGGLSLAFQVLAILFTLALPPLSFLFLKQLYLQKNAD